MRRTRNNGWRVIFPSGTIGSAYYATKREAMHCRRVYGIIGGYVGRATVTYDDGIKSKHRTRAERGTKSRREAPRAKRARRTAP